MNQLLTGEFLAKKRKEKNLTQSALAERLGVSNKTVSKWETGRCMPDYSVIKPLCQELDITVAELLDGEDKAENSVRLYDESQMLDLIKRVQTLERQRAALNGWLLIIMGLLLQSLRYNFSGSNVKDFISGLLLSLSIFETLLGIYVVARETVRK